jgi:deazaflavin-dependent oxidoreductase (nitroreductase family)
MTGNEFMAWMLRSPFHHFLSKSMMLITVTGRKTGRQYTTPVEYFEEDGFLYVITGRDRTWWRNTVGGKDVTLLLRRKVVSAIAGPILDQLEVEKLIVTYLHYRPFSAKILGIRMVNGIPDPGDVTRSAKIQLFVRIKPNNQA